jgi:hypothetical protein
MLKNNRFGSNTALDEKLDVFSLKESGKKFFVFVAGAYICSPKFKAVEIRIYRNG